MTSRATSEVELIQNPSLGALSIWQFTLGYCSDNTTKSAPFSLLYLVLPIVANADLRSEVIRTKSSLYKLKSKILENEKNAILLTLRDTIPLMYETTSQSIGIAISSELILFDEFSLGFSAVIKTAPKMLTPVENDYKKASKKLGSMMSNMDIWEISSVLGVRF